MGDEQDQEEEQDAAAVAAPAAWDPRAVETDAAAPMEEMGLMEHRERAALSP